MLLSGRKVNIYSELINPSRDCMDILNRKSRIKFEITRFPSWSSIAKTLSMFSNEVYTGNGAMILKPSGIGFKSYFDGYRKNGVFTNVIFIVSGLSKEMIDGLLKKIPISSYSSVKASNFQV